MIWSHIIFLIFNRLHNKGVYFRAGLRNLGSSNMSNLQDRIEVRVSCFNSVFFYWLEFWFSKTIELAFLIKADCEKHPINKNMLNVYNKNTKKCCQICSKLTIKILGSGVVIVNPEHISHLFLVFLWLTLIW